MSDHKARALGITTEYETMCVSAGIGRPFGLAGLYLMIAVALRRVRRETLEEAARVAETFHPDDDRMDRQIKIHVAQAIRSLAVKEGAAQWQDISTAPKDGSKILAWDGDYVIVRADPSGGWSDDFEQYLRLDKWMPLPAPPINAVPKPEGE